MRAKNLRVLEGQYQAGAISASELTQARLALRDAEQLRAEARAQLAESIGVPVDSLENIAFSFDGLRQLPGDAPLKEARRKVLLSRSDILGALARYAASEAALRLEIAKQYPDLESIHK